MIFYKKNLNNGVTYKMTVDQFANQIYELVVNTNSGKLILFNNEILSSLFNKKLLVVYLF